MAVGKTLVLAPEDPERRVTIEAVSGELQLLDGRNLAQNGWFIVRSLLQAEGDGEGGGVGGPPERHPELDADPGRRLLAGRLSPVAEEGGGHRTRRERHGPRDRVPLRGDARRHAGRAAEGEGPALGLVPPVQVRHGGFQRREPPRAVLHPVRAAEDGDVPDRPERVRHHLARDGRRLVPGADGPHDGQRGVPRVARPAAHGRRAAGAAELPALRRLPDGAPRPRRSTSPSSGSRGSPSAAGSTPATSTSRAAPTPARSSASSTPGRRSSRSATRRSSIRPPASSTFIARTASRTSCSRSSTAPSPWRRSTRTIGFLSQGIVDSHLHRYHHLGDASTQTDNLIYDPSLKPYQVEGNRSGTPDDRWVFTPRSPFSNYSGIGSLAAASRALRGYNDALADECLALAKKAYAEERQRPRHAAARPRAPPAVRAPGPGSARVRSWGRCTS